MKKSLVSLLLLVAMLVNILVLAGCEQLIGNGGKTEIRFYHTMSPTNLQPTLNKYIEKFNELYPDIVVKHEQIGGYDEVRDQISKELLAGTQPHIAYCYPDHVAMYKDTGLVQTLDSFISSTATTQFGDGTEVLGFTQEQIDDFIDAYYEEGKQFGDGLMYTLPMCKSTEVLYYNKTFFEAHAKDGLKVPETWEEMAAACELIKQLDPNCTAPLGYDSEANWFITMCEQYGSGYTSAVDGNRFIFDNETNREFVKTFNSWFNKQWVTTKNHLSGSYTSDIFKVQKSYMSIGSSAGAGYQRPAATDAGYPFEVGIAPIPQVDPENPKAISQGPSLCMFKASQKEMEATWLFMKFLTTNIEFQAEFSMVSGYMPVINSVMENPMYAAFMEKADGGDGIQALSVKIGLEMVDMYYTSPAFSSSSVARDQVGELLTSALGISETGTALDTKIKELFEKAIYECKYAAGESTK